MTSYKNGTPWLDTNGDPIQAHGGYIINHGGYYYWYGEYYMLSSYCTGWEPNQGKYSRSTDIADNWRIPELFGDSTTFDSQPAFVLPVEKDGSTGYIYFGDRWCYKSLNLGVSNDDDTIDYYARSTYVVLKINFDADGNPYINMADEFTI